MNDGDVIVPHCQVERSLLVLRVKLTDVKQSRKSIRAANFFIT